MKAINVIFHLDKITAIGKGSQGMTPPDDTTLEAKARAQGRTPLEIPKR